MFALHISVCVCVCNYKCMKYEGISGVWPSARDVRQKRLKSDLQVVGDLFSSVLKRSGCATRQALLKYCEGTSSGPW